MAQRTLHIGHIAALLAEFTGKNREITIDITNNRIILHDGATVGGHPVAKLSEFLAHQGAVGSEHGNVTPSTSGFMSGADKTKLDGIEEPPSDTKQFFVYVVSLDGATFPYTTFESSFTLAPLANNVAGSFLFPVPHDFTSLTDAAVMVIPDASETIQWDVFTKFGAVGEAFDANSDSIIDDTLAVINNEITELDITAAFTGLAAGDHVGVDFVSNISDIRAAVLRIRYD